MPVAVIDIGGRTTDFVVVADQAVAPRQLRIAALRAARSQTPGRVSHPRKVRPRGVVRTRDRRCCARSGSVRLFGKTHDVAELVRHARRRSSSAVALRHSGSWGGRRARADPLRGGGAVALAEDIRTGSRIRPSRRIPPSPMRGDAQVPALRLSGADLKPVSSVVTAVSVTPDSSSGCEIDAHTRAARQRCQPEEVVRDLDSTHPAGNVLPTGWRVLRIPFRLKEKRRVQRRYEVFRPLHHRHRLSEPCPGGDAEEGSPFWSVTIAALQGSTDDAQYSYFECRVSGKQAQEIVRQLKPAVGASSRCSWGSRSATCSLKPAPTRTATRPVRPGSA